MAKPAKHVPVMLFVGMLSASERLFAEATAALSATCGPTEVVSPVIDFTYTDYYADEMGPSLKRVFCAFRDLIDPADLARIKLLTNALEEEFAASDARRPINLDPGYLTQAKVVLATAKNYAHRIYLSDGIYAEVTLHWRGGGWGPNPWTYPDYQSEPYGRFLAELRERYLHRLHQAPRSR